MFKTACALFDFHLLDNKRDIYEYFRMHTMPTLPAMDAHAKVYENLKCLLKVSMSKELTAQDKQDVLFEALHMVEDTSVSALTKDQVSKLFTMKGTLLSKLEQ